MKFNFFEQNQSAKSDESGKVRYDDLIAPPVKASDAKTSDSLEVGARNSFADFLFPADSEQNAKEPDDDEKVSDKLTGDTGDEKNKVPHRVDVKRAGPESDKENKQPNDTAEPKISPANFSGALPPNVMVEGWNALRTAKSDYLQTREIAQMIQSLSYNNSSGQLVVQLRDSVFNGLQIKLQKTETGLIAAELVASDSKMRDWLARHSSEVVGLLKENGVNIGSFQTSLQNQSQSEENGRFDDETSAIVNIGLSANEKNEKIDQPATAAQNQPTKSETSRA